MFDVVEYLYLWELDAAMVEVKRVPQPGGITSRMWPDCDATSSERGSGQVWLNTPPQHRREALPFRLARHVVFHWPPFHWFFERKVFAVAVKV